jgi:hypothetical protein
MRFPIFLASEKRGREKLMERLNTWLPSVILYYHPHTPVLNHVLSDLIYL